MAASDWAEIRYLDAAYGDNRATALFPATVYVALFTATPTDLGGGTEVTGGAYARVAVVNNSTNWPNASGGQKSNGTVIQFPEATANWGNVTHFGTFDAATAGNLWDYGALNTALNVLAGMAPKFNAGALVLTAT